MEIIIIILLVIIAYILWRIYLQKEEEKELINRAELMVEDEKSEVEWEKEQKEKFKKYPHLLGNIDYTLLELYGELYVEKGWPHLQMAFAKYVDVANNTSPGIDDANFLFHSLWDLTEELLEHLEKYHESSMYEYEIAISVYWQKVAEKAESFIGKDLEFIKKEFQSSLFTDMQEIISWFPKKTNHLKKEIIFTDENGVFPRESKGSVYINKRIK